MICFPTVFVVEWISNIVWIIHYIISMTSSWPHQFAHDIYLCRLVWLEAIKHVGRFELDLWTKSLKDWVHWDVLWQMFSSLDGFGWGLTSWPHVLLLSIVCHLLQTVQLRRLAMQFPNNIIHLVDYDLRDTAIHTWIKRNQLQKVAEMTTWSHKSLPTTLACRCCITTGNGSVYCPCLP